MKKIAIIGAGFSGLATAWHILNLDSSFQVTLFDPQGFGGEASKTAAGLLHKYAGLHARLNRFGEEAETSTKALLEVASKTLGKPTILSQGIVRIALTENQVRDYKIAADNFADIEWLMCRSLDRHLPDAPAILIQSGITVDVESYLQGLYQACLHKNAKLEKRKIDSLSMLKNYDHVVVAAGAAIGQLEELSQLKVFPLKGQLLTLEWPAGVSPLKLSLVSQVYIAMTADPKVCIVGATYEHEFTDIAPDKDKAISLLMPKAIEIYSPLKKAKILEVKAGLRASTPSHLPLIGQMNNIWYITGMGSRGLLYHSFYAEKLARAICSK